MILVTAALAGCAPKASEPAKAPETAAAAKPAGPACPSATAATLGPNGGAPDVDAAIAAGKPDPRLPSVDPHSIISGSSTGDVMHACVIPGSEILFAQESADAPVTDAAWKVLQDGADAVIKGAELLKSPGRSKGPEWDKTADTVIAAAKTTFDKLGKKNADDLVFDDGDMMAGCTSCHQKFRDLTPPEGKLIEKQPN